MLDALTETLKVFKSMKQYKEGFLAWLSGPKSESREDLEAYSEEQTMMAWHASGTVKMGKKGDESACVDSEFKVNGLERLRVVDMSVAPVNIK
jgi:choline dehydrogenase-like flavoprotein